MANTIPNIHAWVLTESATLPSPILSAGTAGGAPTGAISVPMAVAMVAVCNPAAYVLNSKVVSTTGPDGKTVEALEYFLTDAPLTLSRARLIQKAIIKQGFLSTVSAPVTDSSGNVWEGGMASGNSILLGCQLAQQQGATSITLYDAAKAPHSMTIAEGMAVAALIGAAYQAALGQKNTLYAQSAAATTVADVQAVVWP